MKTSLFAEFVQPEKHRLNLRRLAIGLAVTVVFHALLIYGIVTVRFKVKILSIEPKVTRVFLAPAARVKLPKDYEQRLAKLPSGGGYQGLEFSEPERSSGSSQGSSQPGAPAGEGGSAVGSLGSAQPSAGPPGMVAAPGGASSGFALTYKPGSEKGKVPDLDLSLPGRTLTEQRRRSGGPAVTDARLKSYPGADFSTIGGGPVKGGYALARSGTGDRVIYRGKLPPGVRGEILTAWGRQAVEAVQKNWVLPNAKKESVEGKVGVTVVVERDGRVSAVRLVNSSNISLLDRAAVAAIAASQPFPHLPDGFPGDSLEAYFLFDCNAK